MENGIKDSSQMSDERVKRVYAFIKDLIHQEELLNIVDIWESTFPLDKEEDTPSLLLPILCCEAAGGDEDQATAIAAAWFLLCLAAKVLDDVEDGDVHQGLWSTMGAPQAINAATGLIFASQLALAHLPRIGAGRELALFLLSDFNRTTLRMCAGQHADLTEGSDLSLERYFSIAGAKSGEFFALACRAGALMGTDEVAPYSEFGYNLGVLIQMCDDFEGLWNLQGQSDLAAGKRTLPVIYALTVASPSVRERLERLLVKATDEQEAEEEARRIITALGSPHYLLIEAQIHRQRAAVALHSTGSPSPAYRQLMALLNGRFRVPDDATEISLPPDSTHDKALALLGSFLPPLDHPGPAGSGLSICLVPTLRRPRMVLDHL
jgi:geranylgeranyl pyrophosphate synthase